MWSEEEHEREPAEALQQEEGVAERVSYVGADEEVHEASLAELAQLLVKPMQLRVIFFTRQPCRG